MEDDNVTLSNLNNEYKHNSYESKYGSGETMMAKAIKRNEIDHIRTVLASEFIDEDIKKLSFNDKKKLILMLVELLNGELHVKAMEYIYKLLNDVGSVEGLKKILLQRRTDISKLHYLKGRVDYLKYKVNSGVSRENKATGENKVACEGKISEMSENKVPKYSYEAE